MVNEIWRDIKGYEQLYQKSNFGTVKSVDRISKHSNGDLKLKGRLLKSIKHSGGYLQVFLSKNGKVKRYYIHRLVVEHFLPNPDNKPCIDHINADKSDNRVENLRWVTHKENSDNQITKTKHIKKLKEKLSKPIIQFTLTGELIKKWNSIRDVERELGIDNSSIIRCCKNRQKTAGGYIWRYYYKGIWMKNHIPQKNKKVV